jgi:hypothetical protein
MTRERVTANRGSRRDPFKVRRPARGSNSYPERPFHCEPTQRRSPSLTDAHNDGRLPRQGNSSSQCGIARMRHGKNCAKCGGSAMSFIGSLHFGQRRGRVVVLLGTAGDILFCPARRIDLEQHL